MTGAGFEYTLKKSGLLSGIRLSVRGTGEIVVTAPPWASEKMIERLLDEKKDWLQKSLTKVTKRQKNRPTTVEILGQTYQKVAGYWPEMALGVLIKKGEGEEKKTAVALNNDSQVIVNNVKLKDQSWNTLAESKLTDWLKLTAEKYIRQRVPQLAAKMELTGVYRRIVLKKQSSRWGSCSSEKNLNFNWALIHYSPAVIDYVIIHELAHLQEMNHSARFWAIVKKFDPEYKAHKRVLNG